MQAQTAACEVLYYSILVLLQFLKPIPPLASLSPCYFLMGEGSFQQSAVQQVRFYDFLSRLGQSHQAPSLTSVITL